MTMRFLLNGTTISHDRSFTRIHTFCLPSMHIYISKWWSRYGQCNAYRRFFFLSPATLAFPFPAKKVSLTLVNSSGSEAFTKELITVEARIIRSGQEAVWGLDCLDVNDFIFQESVTYGLLSLTREAPPVEVSSERMSVITLTGTSRKGLLPTKRHKKEQSFRWSISCSQYPTSTG